MKVKFSWVILVLFLLTTMSSAQDDKELSNELRKLADEMVGAFDAKNYPTAKKLAEKILTKLPEGESDYGQCGAVIKDELFNRGWEPIPWPETEYQFESEEEYRKYAFDAQRSRLPNGFDEWDVNRKISFLIKGLDQTWAIQGGYPGGVDLAEDLFVAMLIEIADPAVPALIEALENDERLTRATHFWRPGVGGRILPVKDAALTALMSILRIQYFDAPSTGSSFTTIPKGSQDNITKGIRSFWDKFGKFPFDERMMAVLTDDSVSFEVKREAAWNLSALGEKRIFSTTVWTGAAEIPPEGPNPALEKFSSPTAAEAIFGAMLADLANHDAKPLQKPSLIFGDGDDADIYHSYQRNGIAENYLDPLINLNDVRIAVELETLFNATGNLALRTRLAEACHFLKNPGPLDQLAHEVLEGKLAGLQLEPEKQSKDFFLVIEVVANRSPNQLRLIVETLARDTQHSYRDLYFLSGIDGPLFSKSELSFYLSLLGDKREFPKKLRNQIDFGGNNRDTDSFAEFRHLASWALDQWIFGFPKILPNSENYDERIEAAQEWARANQERLRKMTEEEGYAIQAQYTFSHSGHQFILNYEVQKASSSVSLPFAAKCVTSSEIEEEATNVIVYRISEDESGKVRSFEGIDETRGIMNFSPTELSMGTPMAVNETADWNVRRDRDLAFVGAEGFGEFSRGGRGGKTITVTNLNNSGPGSLRDALEERGPRTIVFGISGYIDLESPIVITNPFLTVAGQSAPGDGICVRGAGISIQTDDVIMRFIRIRPGSDQNGEGPVLSISNCKDVIVDHCSFSWGNGEVISVGDSENITMQWNIISESLVQIPALGEVQGEGVKLSGYKISFHHNAVSNHASTGLVLAPRDRKTGFIDIRKNYIFNWGAAGIRGGSNNRGNIVDNWFVSGPAAKESGGTEIFSIPMKSNSRYHLSGNEVFGDKKATENNWLAVTIPEGKSEENFKAQHEFPHQNIRGQDPDGWESLVRKVGATMPERDAVDLRVVKQLETVSAEVGDIFGENSGLIKSQKSVGGWPELITALASKDSDGDGMPDSWENARKLDASDPKDAIRTEENSFWTELEVYLDSLTRAETNP